MNIKIELTEDDMFEVICAFDAKEVLLRQNARKTDLPYLKQMFLDSAKKAHENMYKWIQFRDAMFR